MRKIIRVLRFCWLKSVQSTNTPFGNRSFSVTDTGGERHRMGAGMCGRQKKSCKYSVFREIEGIEEKVKIMKKTTQLILLVIDNKVR